MVKAKICGVTNFDDALLVANLGSDFIGLNFWPESPRKVSVKNAKEIRNKVQQWEKIIRPIGKIQKFKVRFALGRYVETMIILWRSDYYAINSIEADARKTYLYITATRVMPGTITIV